MTLSQIIHNPHALWVALGVALNSPALSTLVRELVALLKGARTPMNTALISKYLGGIVAIGQLGVTEVLDQSDTSKTQEQRIQEEIAAVGAAAPGILKAFGVPDEIANDFGLPEVVQTAQAIATLAETLIAKKAPAAPANPQ